MCVCLSACMHKGREAAARRDEAPLLRRRGYGKETAAGHRFRGPSSTNKAVTNVPD